MEAKLKTLIFVQNLAQNWRIKKELQFLML